MPDPICQTPLFGGQKSHIILHILCNLGNAHIYLGNLIPCFVIRDTRCRKIEYLLEVLYGICSVLTVYSIYSYGANSRIVQCYPGKLALKLGDYCVTEAGFGSDLGAEKFFDIKCRFGKLKPACVVLVATIRAMKYNGGVKKEDLTKENLWALEKGMVNLQTHIENMHKFHLPVVVAINRFHSDTEEEIALMQNFCKKMGVDCALCEVFAKGGEGGLELAKRVCETIDMCSEAESEFRPLYDEMLPIKEKIRIIATEIYRADDVVYTAQAEKAIKEIEGLGFGNIPVCIAKTQYSLSDNPALLGKPKHFSITVRDLRLSSGAGFVVALTGDIMTMPGLPKEPAALRIDCDNNGCITGLF